MGESHAAAVPAERGGRAHLFHEQPARAQDEAVELHERAPGSVEVVAGVPPVVHLQQRAELGQHAQVRQVGLRPVRLVPQLDGELLAAAALAGLKHAPKRALPAPREQPSVPATRQPGRLAQGARLQRAQAPRGRAARQLPGACAADRPPRTCPSSSNSSKSLKRRMRLLSSSLRRSARTSALSRPLLRSSGAGCVPPTVPNSPSRGPSMAAAARQPGPSAAPGGAQLGVRAVPGAGADRALTAPICHERVVPSRRTTRRTQSLRPSALAAPARHGAGRGG